MLTLCRRSLTPVLAIALLGGQGGCARNPVTGNLQLALISEAQEIQMGQQAAQEVQATMGLVDDAQLQAYVNDIGQRLAANSERPNIPWSFAVVDDPTPNAFALPGGPIFVTRGMMNLMSTEAQLASVLGHEIGHVTARHHVTSMSRQQLAQLGLGIGGMIVPQVQQLGSLAGAGLQLLFLSHGRDAERQADDLGFQYSLAQGFDVREMAVVFTSLQRLGDEGQRSAVPSWLMTHPAPGDRVAATEARLATMPAPASALRIGRQPYLDQLQGLIYGENPRNGYFRNNLFLHPDMRFQLTFPDQWQTQNLSQAVMAMSPQQNAIIQLTLAQGSTPEAAAQQFLGQQGLVVGQTGRQPVNGLPAAAATFQAQTEQGVIQGLVVFVAHAGQVFQLLAYSPANAYASYDPVFQQALRSFAPVSDPQVLNVRPNTISVVRTTESMTLAQFNQRYPSAVDLEELAVMNQLSGGGDVIPAGSLIKRVVQG